MTFLILLAIPVVISLLALWRLPKTITFKEFLVQLSSGVLVVIASWFIAKYSAISDTENLNGRITRKVHGTESCCHCRDVCQSRDSKGNCKSSRRECDHTTDYYWALETTVGRIGIESCSGWDLTPLAWKNAQVGEPASVGHTYLNYLLADPDSLFVHKNMGKFLGHIPKYPSIYNYYKVDHIIGLGVDIPVGWQETVREINADLGSVKQVDITILLTKITDPTYAQALEAKWLYGPKNSLTIVMGVEGQTISWVRIVTVSKVELLKVHLRDNLQGLSLDDPKVLSIIRQTIAQEFKRTPMAEFEYLMDAAQPKGGTLAFLIILQLMVSIGLTVLMHKNDLFGEQGFRSYYR